MEAQHCDGKAEREAHVPDGAVGSLSLDVVFMREKRSSFLIFRGFQFLILINRILFVKLRKFTYLFYMNQC